MRQSQSALTKSTTNNMENQETLIQKCEAVAREWMTSPLYDEKTQQEVKAMMENPDKTQLIDAFYKTLEFGTGGLRGIMGAGTNRMNIYTVGAATQGLSNYLNKNFKDRDEISVVVGHDCRNNSRLFAETSANIFSANGIKVYLFEDMRPTPEMSFAIRHLGCQSGIILTASHNPKEYNGYKVYDEFGCQLVPWQAKQVISYVDAITDYHTINFKSDDSLVFMADVTDNFVMAVMKQSRYKNTVAKNDLKIVYTPLHGTGNVPVQKALRLDDFTQLDAVAEQVVPDGSFPTVVSPNPEDRRALEMGIAQAKRTNADIVLGTDPDSDRVGIAVKKAEGEYQLMTGNQVGALLMNFVLSHTDMAQYAHPAVVKTVVTSELGADIARKHGIKVFSTLTGFKFIGEKITQFEQAKKNGKKEQDYDFLFGYEESYGYLAGTHARDKDAVVSSLLICEMAAEAKANGKTLLDEMNEIYAEYGLVSFTVILTNPFSA